jgi:hypothetical protein
MHPELYAWGNSPLNSLDRRLVGSKRSPRRYGRVKNMLLLPGIKPRFLGRTTHNLNGRSIGQAVSRRLPTAAPRVQTRVWSCGILWWTKVALGQVFSENFGFPCQSICHMLLHNHLHYHSRLAQQARSGRSANNVTNQIKNPHNLCAMEFWVEVCVEEYSVLYTVT